MPPRPNRPLNCRGPFQHIKHLVNRLKDGVSSMEGSDPSAMRTVPFYWPLSQWEDAENDWERTLANAESRRTEPSPGSSNALGDATVGTNTSGCSEISPRLSMHLLEPEGSLTEAGNTCLWSRVASCHANTEESSVEAFATDKDLDADGDSRAPTPWPESWYEGGSELGLQRFAAQVIADCRNYHREAEDDDGELLTGQCSLGNDAGHHNRHEHMSGHTTAGAGSPSGQAAQSRAKSSGGHPAKRQRTGGDGGDEEDRSPKRREANGPLERNPTVGKFYACPYQKRNPQQSPLCGIPHGSKRDFGWNTVSRIKQHLLESHGLDHHCRNCWKAYKNIQHAQGCHETRNCLQRPSPPKHWLSETQIAHLKAERVTRQSDEAWYRIADIVFDNEQGYNPECFRADHTPYYGVVNHPWRSPGSMWTPASDSTNPPWSTPMPGNQTVAPPIDSADEREVAITSDPLPHQQAQEHFDQPGLETIITGAVGDPESVVDQAAAVNIPAIISTDDYTLPETTSGFLSKTLFDVPTAQNLDEDQLERFFPLKLITTDPSQPHLSDLCQASPAAAISDSGSLPQFTETITAVEPPAPACSSCGHTPKCTCRLRKRVADLRSENESLWAEKEKMRASLDRLRQMLESQDELLQVMDDKGVVPDEAMGRLWSHQDRMRAVVMAHR